MIDEVKVEILLLVAVPSEHKILLIKEGEALPALPRAYLNEIQTCKGMAVAMLNHYTGIDSLAGWVDINHLGIFDELSRTTTDIRTIAIAFSCMLPECVKLLIKSANWYNVSDIVKGPLADDHLRIISHV